MFFNNLTVELEYRDDFLAAYRDDIDENGFGFLLHLHGRREI